MEMTIELDDEQLTALNSALEAENTKIDASNRRIQADQDLATANGVVYSGPLQQPLLTLNDLVQMRFNDRVAQDVRERTRIMADTMASAFMKADAATQEAMLQDWAKYTQPSAPPAPPVQKPPTSHKPVRQRKGR